MEGKYRISVFGLKAHLPEVVRVLEETLESESFFEERVQVNPDEIIYIDHGQNPLDDLDCRSYIQVRDPKGEMIFPTSRRIMRFCQRDVQHYARSVREVLQESINNEA